MTDEQTNAFESRPELTTPPTTAHAPRKTESSWPVVIGVIAIIIGLIGLFNGCASMGAMVFVDALADLMPSDEDAEELRAMADWLTFVIIGSTIGIALAGMVITGAIGVLRRRQWGVQTCIAWAVLKIVYEVAMVVPTYTMQVATTAVEDDPNLAGMERVMEMMGIVFTLMGTILGVALPVFLLIWFAQRKIKDEVAGWSGKAEPIASSPQ